VDSPNGDWRDVGPLRPGAMAGSARAPGAGPPVSPSRDCMQSSKLAIYYELAILKESLTSTTISLAEPDSHTGWEESGPTHIIGPGIPWTDN